MEQLKQTVCMIMIRFPVSSDEKALEVKKEIGAVLDAIPEAQLNFSIIDNPPIKPPT